VAQDLEVDVFASFYKMLYLVRIKPEGEAVKQL
jgi:hypothetical protein